MYQWYTDSAWLLLLMGACVHEGSLCYDPSRTPFLNAVPYQSFGREMVWRCPQHFLLALCANICLSTYGQVPGHVWVFLVKCEAYVASAVILGEGRDVGMSSSPS